MRCIIKNIPLTTFGLSGNRGIGFPLTDYCYVFPQPTVEDANCYLVKEEDGITSILTEIENEINVTCTNTEVSECYLVDALNPATWVVDQQSNEYIILTC